LRFWNAKRGQEGDTGGGNPSRSGKHSENSINPGGTVVRRRGEKEEKVRLEIHLTGHLFSRLKDFCQEQKIEPSLVVERALEEYFHMGDIAH
jgi:hypothetical protein